MKKNLYYRSVMSRKGIYQEGAKLSLAFFMGFRTVLEVFIRKNFGERYFSMLSVYTSSIFLALLPFISKHGLYLYYDNFTPASDFGYRQFSFAKFFADNWLWYLFITAFVFFGFKRDLETKRNPSVFDFAKFSLYSGDINKRFFTLFGREWNPRQVETFVEPLFFFIIGLGLCFLGQKLGILILILSLGYSYSYMLAYRMSDHFVMDKIDERICNMRLHKVFVEDDDSDENMGLRFMGRKPTNPEYRKEIVNSFMEGEDENIAFAI